MESSSNRYFPPTDGELRRILQQAQTIALVGHSPKPERPSYQIAQFLRQVGYRVIPVHPAMQSIAGERCYPSLGAVPGQIDIVNVFRQSQYLPAIAAEAVALSMPVVWAQLGVFHPAAMRIAQPTNLTLIMDTCIKIEYQRLGVEKESPHG
ncbi:CoA-binding protein [filamentous cyanobacterium CCP5]|nr:CoA-binding protein [filamentous cyanobacterium CCP5]